MYNIKKLNSNNKTYKKKMYKVFKNSIWLKQIKIIKIVWKISLETICPKSKMWVMYKAHVSKNIFAIWF